MKFATHARKAVDTGRLLQAAFAAALPLLLLARPAAAQYRVGDQGHANDANNRLGSGGYNDTHDIAPRGQPGATANQVVTGNVSGLRGFQGYLPYRDPAEFQGPTASESIDRFLRTAAPVNYAAGSGQSQYTPFYTTSALAGPPPAGFQRQGSTAGLVPSQRVDQGPNDQRLGDVLGTPAVQTARPGDLMLPGPVDPSANSQSLFTASPLYGVRLSQTTDAGDQLFLSQSTNLRPETAADRAKLDAAAIQKMRDELQGTVVPNSQTPGQGGASTGGQDQVPSAQLNSSPSNSGPINDQVASSAQNAVSNSNAPLGTSTATGQGIRQTLLVPPEQQSTQYAELKRRMDQRKRSPQNDATASADFNAQVRAQAAKADATAGAAPGQGATVGQTAEGAAGTTPTAGNAAGGSMFTRPASSFKGTSTFEGSSAFRKGPTSPIDAAVGTPPATPAAPAAGPSVLSGMTPSSVARPQDMVVTSLADGVKSDSLRRLLVQAEDLMKQQKFTSAIDRYETAQTVAPNNPMLTLGRGFSELGASYYGRAEADLHKAIVDEPALLQGFYDLNTLLTPDRVKFLTKDLQDIFASEKQSVRPAFLLAFIAYNTGDPTIASYYVDQAEQRGGKTDPAVQQLRQNWTLPRVPAGMNPAGPSEMNK